MHHGDDAFGERKIVLSPRYLLTKVVKGDYIGVPWGVRPNTWTPPNAPSGTGPFIVIGSLLGDQYLKWNGTDFIGTNVSIINFEGNWLFRIDGEPDFIFDPGNFVYQEFPVGYSFKRATGHLANFKILRIDEHQDHLGRVAFYTFSVNKYDTPGVYLVE